MKNIIAFILFSLVACSAYGQKDKKKGDNSFEQLEYHDAIDHYTKYLSKNSDGDAAFKLAQCYFYTNQFETAESKFEALYKSPDVSQEMYLPYAELLLLNGKSEISKQVVEEYINRYSENDRALLILKSCNISKKLMSEMDHFRCDPVAFNSEVSDYAPVYYQDKILFTSQKNGKTDPWTGNSFSNLFVADIDSNNPKPIEGNLNGKFHNGSASFLNEDVMYFTRNNSKKGKQNDYNLLIAVAYFNGVKWMFKDYFPYNDKDYNTAYPAIDKEGKVLIFSSNKPGGKGGMDLYQTRLQNGQWTEPQNMAWLNTSRDEVFPFIDESNTLYFASNGMPGLGGLDIFKIKLSKKSDTPQNLGAPLNSNRDDFGLITKNDLKSGYFSSNRNSTNGVDNIYKFIRNKQNLSLSGIVLDEWTKIPLKETVVSLRNNKTGETSEFTTQEDGRFSFSIETESSYNLIGIKNNIETTTEDVQTLSEDSNKKMYYTLLHNDPRFSLEGYAINVKDEIGVEGVDIKRFNTTIIEENNFISTSDGFFKFQLEQESDFEISGIKNGYYTSVSEATTKGLNRSTTLYVKLFLNIEEVIIGDTKILGKETFGGWEFENIYYDLDKYNIRPDAAIALNKVVDFLNANPSIEVELGSHTDSRASDAYNMTLSQNRATSAVAYIVAKGIDTNRISAKGYGENNLVNHCSNGIKCTEDAHQKNRRTEIKVLGY